MSRQAPRQLPQWLLDLGVRPVADRRQQREFLRRQRYIQFRQRALRQRMRRQDTFQPPVIYATTSDSDNDDDNQNIQNIQNQQQQQQQNQQQEAPQLFLDNNNYFNRSKYNNSTNYEDSSNYYFNNWKNLLDSPSLSHVQSAHSRSLAGLVQTISINCFFYVRYLKIIVESEIASFMHN